MTQENKIDKEVSIHADVKKVWEVLTSPAYSKIIGNELDKNAYLQSDWTPGAIVYFKYAPDKLVATGHITAFEQYSKIEVDYPDIRYSDAYYLSAGDGVVKLNIRSGPYPDDYEDQLKVWERWLLKVKALSEK